MEITKKLEQVGLGGKKAEVYVAILQLGQASVMQIAKKAGIKRPTTYDILDDLIARKLVTQTFKGKKRLFAAADPVNLKLMLQQQAETVATFLPELKSLYNLAAKKPQIRYFEGREGLRQVYEEILKSETKQQYYFGSIKEMVDVLGKEYLEDWVKRRIKAGIVSHAIRLKKKEVDIKEWGGGKSFLRNLRFFPIDIKEDITTLLIFDNKVVIMSGLAEGYGVLIESKELANTIRYIWQIVWQASKK